MRIFLPSQMGTIPVQTPVEPELSSSQILVTFPPLSP